MKKTYIIAEAGVNHNGNRDMAFDLIDAAAEAGVDAVKFQTFIANKLASKNVEKAEYQKQNTKGENSQLAMLQSLELPQAWHHDLQKHAHKKNIEFLSTAFDEKSLNFLQSLNLPIYKIPSGEITNAPLMWKFARTGKPLIISTGMATLAEIEEALAVVTHAFNAESPPQNIQEVWQNWSDNTKRSKIYDQVTLLHCTSNYPAPFDSVNLKAMNTLASTFNLAVGYSDHTQGIVIPIAAVARGATVIEKHFTLDKNLPGPDHLASIDPLELNAMVQQIRQVEMALGDGMKVPHAQEWNARKVGRQSMIAARFIPQGKKIESEDLTTARTGACGLEPKFIWETIGRNSTKNHAEGEPVIQ